MEKRKNIEDFIVMLFLIFVICYIFYASVSVTFFKMYLIGYEKNLAKICLFAFLPSLYIFIKNKRYRKKDFVFLCLMISGVFISYIYSINREISLYGRELRYEGICAILCYYFLYLLATTVKKDWMKKGILISLLVCNLLQVGYGYIQTTPILDPYLSIPIVNAWTYAAGFVGNSNFFTSLMVMLYFISLGFYCFSKRKWLYLFTYISTSLFFAGIILSGAMSGILAFLITSLVYLLVGSYYFFKEKRKIGGVHFLIKIGLLIPMFIVILLVINKTTESQVIKDFSSTVTEVKEGINEESGSGRIKIWKETLPIIPKYLLTGSGVDTFVEAFENKPIMLKQFLFPIDKAHNEYLQIVVTEGILSLISYLGLIGITFISFFKKLKEKKINSLEITLMLSVIAYLIQAFFNIRITRVAPLFFIVFGLLNSSLDRCDE